MKILTHPVVVITFAMIFFIGGFGWGLYYIGYFNPTSYIPAKAPPPPKIPVIKKEKSIEIEWIQKLSTEMDRRGADLSARERELKDREDVIVKRETELRLEKESLEKTAEKIEKMKKDFDDQIAQVQIAQEGNLAKLSKLYNAMDITRAAELIAVMQDEQCVQLFRIMKDAKTAKILETWLTKGGETAEKAKRLTELIRVAQVPNETQANNP